MGAEGVEKRALQQSCKGAIIASFQILPLFCAFCYIAFRLILFLPYLAFSPGVAPESRT
jgi:hypothetical protein